MRRQPWAACVATCFLHRTVHAAMRSCSLLLLRCSSCARWRFSGATAAFHVRIEPCFLIIRERHDRHTRWRPGITTRALASATRGALHRTRPKRCPCAGRDRNPKPTLRRDACRRLSSRTRLSAAAQCEWLRVVTCSCERLCCANFSSLSAHRASAALTGSVTTRRAFTLPSRQLAARDRDCNPGLFAIAQTIRLCAPMATLASTRRAF